MKINYFVALTLSTLVSVQISSVWAKSVSSPASPTATSAKPSANPTTSTVAPVAQSAVPDSAQQRLQELEQLNQIQEVVNQKVDEKFGLTTSLLNILLLLLILFPIAGLLLLWYYRRNLTDQIKQDVHQEIVPELKAELAKSMGSAVSVSPKGEATSTNPNLSGENVAQLKELITMAMATQNVMSEARSTIEESLNTQTKADELLKEVFERYGKQDQNAYSVPEPESYVAPQPEPEHYSTPAPKPTPADLPQWGVVGVKTYEAESTPTYEQPIQTVSSVPEEVIPPTESQASQEYTYDKHGDDLFLEGRYEDALAAYNQAIQKNIEDYEAWCGKGVVLTKISRYDEAIDAFNQSIRINSNYVEAWYEKSRCYALRGNIDSALENLKRSVDLNPAKGPLAKKDPVFTDIFSTEELEHVTR